MQCRPLADINAPVWNKASAWISMVCHKFGFTFPLRDTRAECKTDKVLLFLKAVSRVSGSRTLPHCWMALKIFFFFLGGMKVIICFWVTSQLCWFSQATQTPSEWEMRGGDPILVCQSAQCRICLMIAILSEDRATAPKQNKPNCNQRSQLVFLSDIWRSVATCFPVSNLFFGFFLPHISKSSCTPVMSLCSRATKVLFAPNSKLPGHRMRVGRVLSDGFVLPSQRQTTCSVTGHTVGRIKRQMAQISLTAYFTEHRLIIFMLLKTANVSPRSTCTFFLRGHLQ